MPAVQPLVAPQPKRRWVRWLTWTLCTLLVLAAAADLLIARFIRRQLAEVVRRELGAEFAADSLVYLPPFSASLRNPQIIVNSADRSPRELLHVASAEIRLRSFPRKGEPLLIDRLVLTRPVVRLTLKPEGTFEIRSLFRATPKTGAPRKLSELFRAAFFQIRQGAVEYEDRRHAGTPPVSLQNVDLTINGSSETPAAYRYLLSVGDPDAQLASAGTFNVDAATMDAAQFTASVSLAPSLRRWPMPPRMRQAIEARAVAGRVRLDGSGAFSFRDPAAARYQAALMLSGGVFCLPGSGLSVVADARLSVHPGDASAARFGQGLASPSLEIQDLALARGPTLLNLQQGVLSLPASGGWKLADVVGRVERSGPAATRGTGNTHWLPDDEDFRGAVTFTAAAGGPFHLASDQSPFQQIRHEIIAYPRGISFQPHSFPHPVEHVGSGSVEFRGGVVELKNLSAVYGGDQVLLDDARIILDDPREKITPADLNQQVRFQSIAGTLIFHQPGPEYPGALGRVIAQLRPIGPFVIGGGSWYGLNRRQKLSDPKAKPDFFFRVTTEGGTLALTDERVPFTDIRGDAVIAPTVTDITRFNAKTLGGEVSATGQITPGRPLQYQGNVETARIDLEQVARILVLPQEKKGRLSGRCSLSARVSGAGPAGGKSVLQQLTAAGEFEIVDGDFWTLPVFGEVAKTAKTVKPPVEIKAGEAAGFFSMADGTVTFTDAAVSAPALGVQGSGTVKLDKSIDLTLVVAPLGDWRDKFRQTRIPFVSDVASEVAGAVQKLFNTAQGALLYNVHVGGTLSKPQAVAVPAPVITEPAARLFGGMLNAGKNPALLDQLRRGAARSPAKK